MGVWIRVSTEDQAQGDSPEHHEGRARAYALAKGWEVARIYQLAGFSGKTVVEHSEFKRMSKDVREGRVQALIFSKLARLARNTRELLDIAEYFKEHDADLVSLQESFDTSSAAGRLFYTVVAAMAQWEREETSERVSAVVVHRAKEGKPLGGKAIYGYQWKDEQLVPNPDEAPVRALMFDLFLELRRLAAVARTLNERGYRTRAGKNWSYTSIRRLLMDPTAKGLHRANYTKSRGKGRAHEIKPESEWIHTPVEAIVEADKWDEVNAILESWRTGTRKPSGRVPKHVFAGLTYCHCGKKMYVPSNMPKYYCRACKNKIPVDDLEAVFFEQLQGYFGSEDSLRALLEEASDEIQEKERLLKTLQKEERASRNKGDQLFRLHSAGHVSDEAFGRRYRPLEERLSQLEDEIPRLQGDLDFLRMGLMDLDTLTEDGQTILDQLQSLDLEDKRVLVESLTSQIIVGEEDVAIRLIHLPFLLQDVTTSQRMGVRAGGLVSRTAAAAHALCGSATPAGSQVPFVTASISRSACSPSTRSSWSVPSRTRPTASRPPRAPDSVRSSACSRSVYARHGTLAFRRPRSRRRPRLPMRPAATSCASRGFAG